MCVDMFPVLICIARHFFLGSHVRGGGGVVIWIRREYLKEANVGEALALFRYTVQSRNVFTDRRIFITAFFFLPEVYLQGGSFVLWCERCWFLSSPQERPPQCCSRFYKSNRRRAALREETASPLMLTCLRPHLTIGLGSCVTDVSIIRAKTHVLAQF